MTESQHNFSIKRLFDVFRGAPSVVPARPDDRGSPPAPFRVKSEADLVSESLKRVWDVLEPKRGQRRFLSRSDINPGELVFILPLIALIEVHQPQMRFRHRLAGTGFRDVFGFEPTGTWVEDWPNVDQRGLLVRCYVATVEAREAIGYRSDFVIDKRPISCEALLVPLSNNGETIDMLFLAASSSSIRPKS